MTGRILNLLLVEDHRDSAVALAALLRAFGHRVDIASTCREARQAFAAHRYDLLLCDLGLPDGDGCALLTELKQQRRLTAIAITGYGMPEDVERCRSAGFLTHITKPIVADRLRAILDEISQQTAADVTTTPISAPLAGL